jgi:hypothetical protein
MLILTNGLPTRRKMTVSNSFFIIILSSIRKLMVSISAESTISLSAMSCQQVLSVWQKYTLPRSVRSRWEIRWQAVMVTKVSLPG